MTLKEITAMRKTGHLKEALQEAEVEFSRKPDSNTASCLFWCLNDIIKQQPAREASETFERMKTLMQEHCPADELMQKILLHTERLTTIPHYQEIKEATEKAKREGNALTSFSKINAYYNAGEVHPRSHGDFGWLIYYALKETGIGDIAQRKSLIDTYMHLNMPRPSLLHSRMLSEAMRLRKDAPDEFSIIDFARIWGLENLTDDDWTQFTTHQGAKMLSLAERLIGSYTKEIRALHVVADDEFCRLVDKALAKFPGSQNMPYSKAITLTSHGKTAEAIEYYKALAQKFPSKHFLFDHMASLANDPDTKIGLLSKVLVSRQSEDFMGGVRLRLAKLLIDKNLHANAKYEIDRYKKLHDEKKWGLNREFRILNEKLKDVTAVADNRKIYYSYIPAADEFIYSSLPTLIAMKVSERRLDDRYHPGKKITYWQLNTANGDIFSLKNPGRYGLNWRTPDGTQLYVKVLDGKVVWANLY